jgi:hypothetical protein
MKFCRLLLRDAIKNPFVVAQQQATKFHCSFKYIPLYVEPAVDRNLWHHHMLAASFGEVAACLIRVPVEIVKQRRQAFSGVTRPCHALLGPLFTLTIFGEKNGVFLKNQC